jgi:rubrerythrin
MRTAAGNGNATALGKNRTGLATSPDGAAEMLRASRSTVPSAKGDASGIAAVRIEYARQGEPQGSLPPPASLKEAMKGMAKAIAGKKAPLLVDKMAERLAFERSGTRLYDALLSKFDAYGSWQGGPSREDLEEIHEEEHEHFLMLEAAVTEVGADPTAVTPSANVVAVAGTGWCAVLTDPRTNLRQGLETILQAELVDNDCWETLIDLARTMGQVELADRFEHALEQERDHLVRVRGWLAAGISAEAAGRLTEPFARRAEERRRSPTQRAADPPAAPTRPRAKRSPRPSRSAPRSGARRRTSARRRKRG